MECHGMERNGMYWNVMECHDMECNGMLCSLTDCNAMYGWMHVYMHACINVSMFL